MQRNLTKCTTKKDRQFSLYIASITNNVTMSAGSSETKVFEQDRARFT